jgi:hypothetical protein
VARSETRFAELNWLLIRWRWVIGLVIVLLVVAGPTFPGRANHDTDAMVQNMDTGSYTDWWSPILMMAWRPLYEIGVDIGWIQIGQIVAVFVGVAALIRPLFVRQWHAVAATIVICLFPTTYGMLINVIRDTWFTAAVVGTLGVIYRTRTPSPVHGALLLLGLLAIVAARQNGVVVVIVLSFAAAANWGLLRVERSRMWRVVTWSGLAIAAGVLFYGGTQLITRITDVTVTGPETATFYVDLDEMSTRVGHVLVPDVYIVDSLTLDDLAQDRNYTADGLNGLVRLRLPPEDRPAAARAWREAVLEHPRVYLQARWQMFTRQVGWSGSPAEAYYPTEGTSAIYSPWSPRLSELGTSYLAMFDGGSWQLGGFLHRPWIYIVVAIAAAIRHGRRWPVLYTVPAVQVSVLAGLFFLSPISKVRLAYPIFVLGLVAATYLLAGRGVLQERERGSGSGTMCE